MKKLVLSLAVLFAVGMVSCDNSNKAEGENAECAQEQVEAPAEEGAEAAAPAEEGAEAAAQTEEGAAAAEAATPEAGAEAAAN